MHKLSIIIPVLNEAEILSSSLQALLLLQARGVEIIVVDGGSQDESCQLIREAGLTLLVAPRGRAKQMNVGAQQASGDVLLFLHVDTQLPAQADAIILQQFNFSHGSNARHTLSTRHKVWGRFAVRISGPAKMLAVISFFMNLRCWLTGIATGDHALFMSRAAFNEVGGFPEQPLMEDVALCARLKKLSSPLCLSDKVITSGRRWLTRGIWPTIFLMWRLRWLYWRGVSPQKLAKEYQ